MQMKEREDRKLLDLHSVLVKQHKKAKAICQELEAGMLPGGLPDINKPGPCEVARADRVHGQDPLTSESVRGIYTSQRNLHVMLRTMLHCLLSSP